MKYYIVSMLCLGSFYGCSGNYYTLKQPSYNQSQYSEIGTATETATGISLFGVIPIQLNNKVERAMNAAIASKGGDAMTDVQIRERWYWAYVLNLYKVDVTGTVLKKK